MRIIILLYLSKLISHAEEVVNSIDPDQTIPEVSSGSALFAILPACFRHISYTL